MITHNIALDLPNIAILLDVPLLKLRKTVPAQYAQLTLQQIDVVGKHLKCTPARAEEQKIVCLETPGQGWRKVFVWAAKPSKIPSILLDQIEFYMDEAPFLSSIIEVLHWLNQQGFYKQESIHRLAGRLSQLGIFKFFVIPKGDKRYRKYYGRLMNPPILE